MNVFQQCVRLFNTVVVVSEQFTHVKCWLCVDSGQQSILM